MKKTAILLSMAAALAGQAQPYGENLYPHNNTMCSSGAITSVNTPGTGFIISGYVPNAASGTANYYVDKTGSGGFFAPAAALPFSNSYMVRGDKSCSAAPPQAVQIKGIDVIEATTSNIGGFYAKAGVFEHGCFFSMLDGAGNPVSTGFYTFPAAATNATRPTIIASNMATEYFICGSYVLANINIFYIVNVKETGTPAGAGSRTYTYPSNNSSVIPNDMILSPYVSNELVVVGQITNPFGTGGTRAFFIRINTASLFLNSGFQLWGQGTTTTGNDIFNSITVATSTSNGGNGFAIGGTTDRYVSTSGGRVWALKVDQFGTTPRWNLVYRPTQDINATTMLAIKERIGSAFGPSYFGAVTSAAGMMVVKLDDNGAPYTGTAPLNFNEFIYRGPFSQTARVRDLTLIPTTASSDVGIQVFGTAPGLTGGNHYFAEATFNGVSEYTGCSTSNHFTGMPKFPGPLYIQQRDPSAQQGLTYCQSFMMIPAGLNPNISTLCSVTTLPAGGSNARPSVATGISTQQGAPDIFNVSPNPVSDKLTIKITANESDAVDIKLFDYLGRFIKSVPVTAVDGNVHVAGLDMSVLNIESGIYIINATVNDVSSQQKIIYTK